MGDLQPDIAGYIASLGTTHDPLGACNSCQRALIYGAMMYAGSVKAEVDRVDAAIRGINPVDGAQALRAAVQHAGVLVEILGEFVRADFMACLPGAEYLSPDDWTIAMSSFFQARTETYVDQDGKVMFEPHEPHEPEEGDTEEVQV